MSAPCRPEGETVAQQRDGTAVSRGLRHAATAAAMLSIVAASACGLQALRPEPAPAAAAAAPPRMPLRTTATAQAGDGVHRPFAVCSAPACPVVTPKTLAMADPAPAPHPQRVPVPVEDEVDREVGSPGPRDVAPAVASGIASGIAFGLVSGLPTRTALARPAPPIPVAVAAAVDDTGSEPAATRELVVLFPFASALLSPAARAALDQALSAPGLQRLTIRARTDAAGPPAANAVLARARAAAVERHVRRRLEASQAPAIPIDIDAQGGCCYAAPNDHPQGRALNRRVELRLERRNDAP